MNVLLNEEAGKSYLDDSSDHITLSEKNIYIYTSKLTKGFLA